MKNKKLLYVVLPATILVWGIAFKQIYQSLYSDLEISLKTNYSPIESVSDTLSNYTFSIVNNYRDPFALKPVSFPASNTSAKNTTAKKALPPPLSKQEAQWPALQYSGMIKNQKSNKQLALLQINGSLKTLKSGEIFENIQIGKIYKDSIEVTFNKQKRFVKK